MLGFSFSKLFAKAVFVPLLMASGIVWGQAYRIEERSVWHRIELHAEAFAESAVPIVNPLQRPQITYVISDGAWADEGGLLTAFDATEPSNELARAYSQQVTAAATLERDMADIDNSELTLQDRLAEVRDKVAVLEAQQASLLALPDTNEVAIAESRLRVRDLAWVAASNEFVKAEARFSDKLISLQERDTREAERDEAWADLVHAKQTLAITSRPAEARDLRKLELELDNLRREEKKVKLEIEDNNLLVGIRKRGAGVQLERIKRQIAERESDLKSVNVKAPLSGYVMYMADFRRNILDGGNRMWKRNIFLKIPDPDTIAFKGEIPENMRRFVAVGDPARLRIVGFRDKEVEATLSHVGTTARDTAEREQQRWGDDRNYGVKVYDVVLKPNKIEPWMRVGSHAEAVILPQQPTTAPTVPLQFVRMVDGKPHLNVDGRDELVSGVVSQSWLVLDDPSWTNRVISLETPVAPSTPDESDDLVVFSNGSVTVKGELLPRTSTPVAVGAIQRWQKITWLIPEDTVVTQGMVVARLEEKDTLDEIANWEEQLTSRQTERETQEQNNAILERDQTYQLSVASNAVEIARLNYKYALDFRDDQRIADSQLAVDRATVRLRKARDALDRIERLPAERVAAVERLNAQRTLARAELQLESAMIQLTVAQRGKEEIEIERLRLAYEEAKLDLAAKVATAETDRINAEANLLKAWRRERYTQRELDRRREWLANLTLRAPCDGTVRYNRIWSDNALRRIQIGTFLGRRFTPMQIVDATKMEIRAEVPEQLFEQVKAGDSVDVRIPSISDATMLGTVREIEYLFEQRRPKEAGKGLYSSHEALGETVFHIRVDLDAPSFVELKPGSVATVTLRASARGRL